MIRRRLGAIVETNNPRLNREGYLCKKSQRSSQTEMIDPKTRQVDRASYTTKSVP